MEHPRPVVVLDFGSQYTQLIARRIRELQVYALIVPCHTPFAELRGMNPLALVLSGGPSSVYDPGAPVCDERVLRMNIPVLGVCYGLQWISRTLGGRVEPARRREYGFAQLEIYPSTGLLKGIPSPLRVWNSHGDHVAEVPPGFEITGKTENAIAAIENPQARIYALEFHPEVRHTDHGAEILKRFIRDIAGIEANWFPALLYRRNGGADPAAGRGRTRPVRAFRRSGFRRCRHSRGPGHRRPPYLLVRG